MVRRTLSIIEDNCAVFETFRECIEYYCWNTVYKWFINHMASQDILKFHEKDQFCKVSGKIWVKYVSWHFLNEIKFIAINIKYEFKLKRVDQIKSRKYILV